MDYAALCCFINNSIRGFNALKHWSGIHQSGKDNIPCSFDGSFHYTAGSYTLQQPGNWPVYFKIPRKCNIFWMCFEESGMQVFSLVYEATQLVKGQTTCEHGTSLHVFHFDMVASKNRNNILLWYSLWRLLLGNGDHPWMHSFVFVLPDMNDMLPEVNYDRLPNRSASLLQTVHMDILQQTEELKEYARTNIDALPKEDMKTIRKRGKRSAPLAFIGGLSKSLFCTATYDDVAKVARKVNRIIATERKLDKGVLHLTENLESYMKVNDDRTDRIKALVDATHGEVQAVEKTLQAMRSMEKVKKEFLINLTTAMDSQMYIAGKLRERLIEIRYAIDALSEGKLPKSLITVQDIQSVLTDANEQIGVRKHFGDRFRFTVLTPIST